MEHLKVLDNLTTDDDLVIEGYLALYGGDDLTGERFTRSTQFDSDYTRLDAVLIDWEHGQRPDGKASPGADDVLGRVDWKTAVSDDTGLLVRRILDRRNRYVSKIIEPLARAGLLGSSSEAVPELVQKTGDGTIKRWPVKRDSFTVNPAEPRLLTQHQMQVVKSLVADYPALKTLLLSEGAEESTAETAGQIDTHSTNEESKIMDKEQVQALIAEAVKAALANQESPDVASIAEQAGQQAAAAALKAYQAALDAMPAPKKAGAEVVEDETDKFLKTAPRIGLMLQAVRNRATQQPLSNAHKAILGQNESVPEDGGYLVGTEQENSIEKKMFDSAVFASRAQTRTIGANANSVDFYGRSENSRATGSRYGGIRGYRVAEGQTITASDMKFFKYTVKPEKYAVLAYATDEVASDAALLESEIMEAAPQELAFMIDDDMMSGVAAGYPQGVKSAAALVTVAKEGGQAADTIVAANIIKMWARLYARSRANAVWFINQDVEPQLHLMEAPVGTGGALVYLPPGGLSASPYGSLYGRPVIATEFNSTLGDLGDIMLIDWSQYKLANKGGVKSASSMHVQFVTDQMAWRFTTRYDGQSSWESALTPYKGTNTQSPFIALAERA